MPSLHRRADLPERRQAGAEAVRSGDNRRRDFLGFNDALRSAVQPLIQINARIAWLSSVRNLQI